MSERIFAPTHLSPLVTSPEALGDTLRASANDVIRNVIDTLDVDLAPKTLRRLAGQLHHAAQDLELAVVADAQQNITIPEAVDNHTAAQRVRQVRLALGLTTEELARATGLSESTIKDFERGKRAHRPRVAVLIADGLSHVAPELDSTHLEVDLSRRLERDGLLAPPSENEAWDADWITRRRRNQADGPAIRHHAALRRFGETTAQQ